jgi:hypothetical protein
MVMSPMLVCSRTLVSRWFADFPDIIFLRYQLEILAIMHIAEH